MSALWLMGAASVAFTAHVAPRQNIPHTSVGMDAANVDWQVGVPNDIPLCKPFGRESVVAAIESIKRGEVICVTDDESRENEGDLIMACEHSTAHTIGFIVRYTSGVICCAVPDERLKELELPVMLENNQDPKGTAFHITTDVKSYGSHETSTGISAADRAATFNAIADPAVGPDAFCRPGHVFPLRARPGGVRERDGHTEAALDFAKLAGCQSAGVLSEVCNEDGSMSRIPQLLPFCERHRLVLTSISDLIAYMNEQA